MNNPQFHWGLLNISFPNSEGVTQHRQMVFFIYDNTILLKEIDHYQIIIGKPRGVKFRISQSPQFHWGLFTGNSAGVILLIYRMLYNILK